jgi:hypothetical protein
VIESTAATADSSSKAHRATGSGADAPGTLLSDRRNRIAPTEAKEPKHLEKQERSIWTQAITHRGVRGNCHINVNVIIVLDIPPSGKGEKRPQQPLSRSRAGRRRRPSSAKLLSQPVSNRPPMDTLKKAPEPRPS